MLYSAIKIIWSILSVSIIFLVLLHSPKGDGVAGIGGQAQMFSSTRSAEASLNRLTWGLTIFFLALSIILSAGWISPTDRSQLNQPLPITAPGGSQSELQPGNPSGKQTVPSTLPAPNQTSTQTPANNPPANPEGNP
jgi:preprotein translocase subunit SecG